jgi:hypothetical protein
MVNLPASSALIGIQKDMTLAKTKSERCTALSCSLRPEYRSQPIVPFVELYDSRYKMYNAQTLAKMTLEQLANFQFVVRMEIQFLCGWDVQWKAEGGGPAGEGGAGAAGSQDGMAAGSASGDALTAMLSVLPQMRPPPAATAAGTMASNEDHLLRVSFALRISQETYASLPSAGAPGSPAGSAGGEGG